VEHLGGIVSVVTGVVYHASEFVYSLGLLGWFGCEEKGQKGVETHLAYDIVGHLEGE